MQTCLRNPYLDQSSRGFEKDSVQEISERVGIRKWFPDLFRLGTYMCLGNYHVLKREICPLVWRSRETPGGGGGYFFYLAALN
jgi:hypothetical protein